MATAEPTTDPGLAILDEILETVEKKKSDPPPKPKFGSKPPADGPCKRCGDDKPLNRLFLCYKCWVITQLEDRFPGWKPGDNHPSWCKCDIPGAKHNGRPNVNLG